MVAGHADEGIVSCFMCLLQYVYVHSTQLGVQNFNNLGSDVRKNT